MAAARCPAALVLAGGGGGAGLGPRAVVVCGGGGGDFRKGGPCAPLVAAAPGDAAVEVGFAGAAGAELVSVTRAGELRRQRVQDGEELPAPGLGPAVEAEGACAATVDPVLGLVAVSAESFSLAWLTFDGSSALGAPPATWPPPEETSAPDYLDAPPACMALVPPLRERGLGGASAEYFEDPGPRRAVLGLRRGGLGVADADGGWEDLGGAAVGAWGAPAAVAASPDGRFCAALFSPPPGEATLEPGDLLGDDDELFGAEAGEDTGQDGDGFLDRWEWRVAVLDLDSGAVVLAPRPFALACAPPSKTDFSDPQTLEGPDGDSGSHLQAGGGEWRLAGAMPGPRLAWCGGDLVCCAGAGGAVLVSGAGECLRLPTSRPPLIFPEEDGVRLVTPAGPHGGGGAEFVRAVPPALRRMRAPGSTDPPALLLEAFSSASAGGAGGAGAADALLRSLAASGGLTPAVQDCMAAGGEEMAPHDQRRALRAAAFGAAFLPVGRVSPGAPAAATPGSGARSGLEERARLLRVANAVADISPLTLSQLRSLGVDALLARLCAQGQHFLALRAAAWLGMPQGGVVRHWASEAVRRGASSSDADLCAAIVANASAVLGASFADIAADAHRLGRRALASLVLGHEQRPGEQVPLLSTFGEHDQALERACSSGDPSLICLALLGALSRLPAPDVLALVSKNPSARGAFRAWAGATDQGLLQACYLAAGLPERVAEHHLAEAIGGLRDLRKGDVVQGGAAAPVRAVERAAELYTAPQGRTAAAGGATRDNAQISGKLIGEFAKLLKAQRSLEESTGQTIFLGTSLAKTLVQCEALGKSRAVSQLKQDFRLSEKQVYWLRVRALASEGDWVGVQNMAAERRGGPPAPAEALATFLADAGAPDSVIQQYVSFVPDARERARLYEGLGMLEKAAEAAAQAKDGDLVSRLRAAASGFA